MKKYYSDNRSLNFLRVTVFIMLIGIILGLKYLLYYLEGRFPQFFTAPSVSLPAILIWVFIAAFAVSYVIIILIVLPMWYRSLSYMVSSEEVIINSGIFTRKRQYMKISAIQYTSILSMPFSKYLGLNFLVISAHGGRMAMMFLSHKDITEISGKLQKYVFI